MERSNTGKPAGVCRAVPLVKVAGVVKAANVEKFEEPAPAPPGRFEKPAYCNQIWRSSDRNWMASEMCSELMLSDPARSAMLRATFRIRS